MKNQKKYSAFFLGRSTCDMTYYVNNFPNENIKVFADNFIMQPGGPALNAAITFSLLGGEAVIVSSFGESEIAKSIKSISQNENLEIIDLKEESNYDFPISTIIVNTGKGTRTIINSPKSKTSLEENEYDFLKKFIPKLVMIDGYELENKYDILKHWKAKGAIIVLDGGSWKKDKYKYLHFVDIAICSNRFRFPGMNLDISIDELHSKGIKYVAFTREDEPIVLSINKERKYIEVPKVDAIDTLGAGDVFHGSFCLHYLNNYDFESAVKYAASDASKSCTYLGTHTWIKEQF